MSEESIGDGRAIAAQREELARAVVRRHFARHPHLAERYGPNGQRQCYQDALYHLLYLSEAVANSAPTLFRDYVAWAKALLVGLGIPAQDLAQHLRLIAEVLHERLDPQIAVVVAEYIEQALDAFDTLPSDPPTFMHDNMPLHELGTAYLNALLAYRRHDATRLILDAVADGTSVADVYLYVLQPVLREVGRLWQSNRVSVALEHYCTAVTQVVMARLSPQVFAAERVGRTIVATCVGDELHEVGVRMVADFFEMAGWDTLYLGANVPSASIVKTLVEQRVDVLGVSVTITAHMPTLTDLIATVRSHPDCMHVKVCVGGYPFNLTEGLWQKVGADGYGPDAQTAVDVCNRLVTGGRR
jgi:MerR family transcriptional regulator, light-induced transcriptional regulator